MSCPDVAPSIGALQVDEPPLHVVETYFGTVYQCDKDIDDVSLFFDYALSLFTV